MSNLIVGLLSFAVLIVLVIFAARAGRSYLFSLSVAFILISNITVQMNVEIVPTVVISWAIVVYSLVYLITDFVIEFYGRSVAYRLAFMNLLVQYVLWAYVWLSLMVTPIESGSSAQVYETMRSLFGTTTQVSVAATVAAIGPFSDIFITGRIREYLRTRRLFSHEIFNIIARAKLSTLVGELINTLLFFSIVLFGSGVDFYSQVSIVVSATVVKWIISILDVPFLYFFFRFIGRPRDAAIART